MAGLFITGILIVFHTLGGRGGCLPMHIPVLLAGFPAAGICRYRGIVTPCSSVLPGCPFVPIGILMAVGRLRSGGPDVPAAGAEG